ncbi:MAG: hypothetical protein ACRELY_32570 [Polyangiaceae bacterium]
MARALARSALASAVVLSAIGVAACGGSKPAPKPAPAPTSRASAAAPTAKPATGFLSSQVPMAQMPPAFDFSSKKAEIRMYSASNPALTCTSGVQATGAPASDVAAIVKACAPATKQKASGAAWSGNQKPDAPAQRFPFAAAAGRCYRVYGSAAAGISDISILVVDSAGATAAQGHADGGRVIAPRSGSVCFREADQAAVVVSIGRGMGAFAVQLTSD